MYPTLESQSDILKMFDEMTESRKKILGDCGRLSDTQLNDPVYPGTWSLLKNLAHLAWAEEFMLAWIRKRPGELAKEEIPPETTGNLATLSTALDEAHAAAIAFVKGNAESILKEKCLFGRGSEQTVGGIFFHLIEHEIHHRAFIKNKLYKLSNK